MKPDIITNIDYDNYENRLQNFALQKSLSNLEYSVVTVRGESKDYKEKIKDSTLAEL